MEDKESHCVANFAPFVLKIFFFLTKKNGSTGTHSLCEKDLTLIISSSALYLNLRSSVLSVSNLF